MNQDKLKIMVDGEEKVYDIYFSFTCPQTNKGYIAYSDHEKDNEGNEIILVSSYDPSVSKEELHEITDPKEMQMVEDVFNKIKELA